MQTILENCAGINNRVDPKRPTLLPAEHLYVAEAVNVDVDDSGGVSRRCGRYSLSSVPSDSLFCDGGDFFAVQDGASSSTLCRVNSDFTLTSVRTGLTKSARLSFCQVGARTYYSNGFQNGYVENGTNYAWPSNTANYGATTSRIFSTAPLASHIAYFDGCWWLAAGKNIFVSEFRVPGKFDMLGKRFSFASNVRMVRPVSGGVWVSDSSQTVFIAKADSFKAMIWNKKATVPAHEWSDACQLHDYSRIEIPGLSATWSSDDGQCIGTADGQLIVRTRDVLDYPSGSNGATVVTENEIINSIW